MDETDYFKDESALAEIVREKIRQIKKRKSAKVVFNSADRPVTTISEMKSRLWKPIFPTAAPGLTQAFYYCEPDRPYDVHIYRTDTWKLLGEIVDAQLAQQIVVKSEIIDLLEGKSL